MSTFSPIGDLNPSDRERVRVRRDIWSTSLGPCCFEFPCGLERLGTEAALVETWLASLVGRMRREREAASAARMPCPENPEEPTV